jgi:dUTPase
MTLRIPKLKFVPMNPINLDKIPEYQTQNSGCFDVYSDEMNPFILFPSHFYAFSTGMFLDLTDTQQIELITGNGVGVLPKDTFTATLNICPRSGLAVNYGIDTLAGEVDLDYAGLIKAILINHGTKTITINPGDRICQAKWTLCLKAFGVGTKETKRTGGFGSTNG